MFCIKCGKELKEQWMACPYCGNVLEEKKPLSKQNIKIVKGIICGVIVLAVVMLCWYWLQNDDDKKQTYVDNQTGGKETTSASETGTNELHGELGNDLYAEAEKGLLYSNEKGEITDKNGKVISAYFDYRATENGYISDGESCLEGLAVDENRKLYVFDLEDVEYEEPIEILRKKAYRDGCTTEIITDEYWAEKGSQYDYLATEVADDGNYFDEVVLGAWFDEFGEPIAGGLPNKLSLAVAEHNIANKGSSASGLIENFHFIDGQTFTMDMLKRKSPDEIALYAIVVNNITKRTNSDGNIYFEGWDYLSKTAVIIHGDFSGILNGDDLLVFAEYTGLASDDTPNFYGVLIQNINGKELY